MADLIKLDMTQIWAINGDKTQPSDAKIQQGWVVEAVPRQTWNWFENRQDQNIAYMLQKGLPEWDSTTQYIGNKSYVQRNNIVYKAIATSTGQDPAAVGSTYWRKAFPESTAYLEAIKDLPVTANSFVYTNNSSAADQSAITTFALSLLDDADAAAARTTLNAQVANANLTGFSALTGVNNGLPYFTGAGTLTLTNLTGFARTLLDDADAATMRATLGLGNTSTLNVGTVTGTVAAGDDSRIVNALQNGNNLSDVSNATTARANLGLGNVNNTSDANKPVSTAQQSALDGKQPLDATLTALAGLVNGADQLPYFTGVDAFGSTAFTSFARTLLTGVDAAAMRTTLSVVAQTAATGAAVVPTGAAANRPASPSAGMFRYNTDTNQFEGYQNGSWGDIGGGTAVFSVQWWPGTRASIPSGFLPADGQTVSRAVYPAAWTKISNNEVPNVIDSVWLGSNLQRGNFSTGDGSTTFRLPDYNGKSSGTRGALFQRGDGTLSAGTIGAIQEDAFQGHWHTLWGELQTSASGSVKSVPGSSTSTVQLGTDQVRAPVTDGTNGTPRVAGETRSLNITGVWIIKLAGAGINTGTVDVTALAANAYQKSNILGVVSQASGTPTGAIIERGSNANGEYVKFADGTMICTRRFQVTISSFSALAGSGLYFSAKTGAPIMPATFITSPVTNITLIDTSSVAWVSESDAATTSTFPNMYIVCAINTVPKTFFVDLCAIGRWF